MRHKFLKLNHPRNFAVFVRNVPSAIQNNIALEEFFSDCFTSDAVVEARVPLQMPQLAKAEAQRDATLANLEHALARYQLHGVRPKHKDDMIGLVGHEVDSIEYYTQKLEEQNEDVSERITKLELIANEGRSSAPDADESNEATKSADDDTGDENSSSDEESGQNKSFLSHALGSAVSLVRRPTSKKMESESIASSNENLGYGATDVPVNQEDNDEEEKEIAEGEEKNVVMKSLTKSAKTLSYAANKAGSSVGAVAATATSMASMTANKATKAVSSVANTAAHSATKAASQAMSLVFGAEEGHPYSSGFVVFNKLSTVNAALQMIHHERPFKMEIIDAPDPQDIFWFNVGRKHKDLQIGNLLSLGASAALCLLWTIPISFFASLSNAAAVREDVEFLDDLFDRFPALIPILEQLAPFLVVIFNALLPAILEAITMFEGPISSGRVEASLFVKLAAFMIIQTFFVSAISGSILQVRAFQQDVEYASVGIRSR